MGALIRRLTLLTAIAAAVLLPMACDTGPTGPAGQVSLVLRPVFSATGDVAGNAQLVDRVHVVLETEAGVVVDSMITWPLDQDTLSVAVTVSVQSGATETFSYTLEGLAGDVVLFEMAGSLDVTGTDGAGSATVTDTLTYVGPGAEAASITLVAPPASILAADTARLTAAITDGTGAAISAPVVWTTVDTAIATVDSTGLVAGRRVVGDTAIVVARVAYRTLADTARIPLLSAGARFLVAEDTITALQDTLTFQATALGIDGAPARGGTFTFVALDPEVATIDAATDTTVRVRSGSNGSARFAAQGGGFTDTATVRVDQEPSHMVVSPADTAFDAVGDTIQLAATVLDHQEHPIAGAEVAWTSTAPQIIPVDAQGRAFALQPGSAGIIATAGTVADTAMLGVEQVMDTFFVAPDTLPLPALGLTIPLFALGLDPNEVPIIGLEITWASDDESVVTVDDAGVITAVGQGTANVTATALDRSDTAVVIVDQIVTSIGLTPLVDTLDAIGATVTFAVDPRDATGNPVPDAVVTWDCFSQGEVLDCTTAAEATAIGVGDGQVMAIVNEDDIAEFADIHVRQLPTSLDVVESMVTFTALQDQNTLAVMASDANGHPLHPSQITWTSREPAIASVDAGGVVTAEADGEAWIVASGGDLADSARAVVGQVPVAITVSPVDTVVQSLSQVTYRASVEDGNGFPIDDPDLTWSSSDTVVVRFLPSANGDIATPLSPGLALVVGTAGTVADTARILVVVPSVVLDAAPADTVIEPTGQVDLTLLARAEAQGEVHLFPVDSFATWTSADEQVATVDGTGVVTGVASGVAPIVATIAAPGLTLVDTAFVVVAAMGDLVSTAFADGVDAAIPQGASFAVPVTLDLSRTSGGDLGFVNLTLQFDTAVIALDGITMFLDAPQPTETEPGTITWMYQGTIPTATEVLFTVHFTAQRATEPGTRTLLDLTHVEPPKNSDFVDYPSPLTVDGRILIVEAPADVVQPPS